MKNIDFYKDWPGLVEPHSEKDAPKGWGTLHFDPHRSKLIVSDDVSFYSKDRIPSAWHRFWIRLFLGWKWERVE